MRAFAPRFNPVSEGDFVQSGVTGKQGTTLYLHQDHLGSSSILTSQTGDPLEYLQYFADGDVWIDRGTQQPENGYKFSGKFFDPETGLYDFGARFYDPKTSLWLGVDPPAFEDPSYMAGSPMSASLYAYVSWNFIGRIDPDGCDDEKSLIDRKKELTSEYLITQDDIQYMLVLSYERGRLSPGQEPGFVVDMPMPPTPEKLYEIIDQPSTGTQGEQKQKVSSFTAIFSHYHGKYMILDGSNGLQTTMDLGPYPSDKNSNVKSYEKGDKERANDSKARVWVISPGMVTEYDPNTTNTRILVNPNDWKIMQDKYGAKAGAQASQEKAEISKQKENTKKRKQSKFKTEPIYDYWRVF